MSEVPYSMFLKGVGVVTILLGFIEIGVGADVWSFLPGVRYGCWWGAFVAVLAGGSSLIANNKQMVMILAWLSAIASILLFSGMISDSLGWRRINNLQTCVNTFTQQVYGAAAYQAQAAACASTNGKMCGCVGKADDFACHKFDINHYKQQNCGLILGHYGDELLVSLIFDTFTLAWVFTLSVMACTSIGAMNAAESASANNYEQTNNKEVELSQEPAKPAPAPESAVVESSPDSPDQV